MKKNIIFEIIINLYIHYIISTHLIRIDCNYFSQSELYLGRCCGEVGPVLIDSNSGRINYRDNKEKIG